MTNEANTVPESAMLDGSASPQSETLSTAGTGETPGTTPTIDDLSKELAKLQAALKKANAESRDHRLKANELDKLKAETEAAKLSESERLQKQLDTLQKERDDSVRQMRELKIDSAVSSQAARLGFADPDDARRFLTEADLELDASGNPTNVEDALKNLLKLKPYLAGKPVQQQSSGGATNPARTQTNAPAALSWDVIGGMKPDEYNARRPEIQAWIAKNPFRYGKTMK